MRFLLVLWSFLLWTGSLCAQAPDTLAPVVADTIAVADSGPVQDSLPPDPMADSVSRKPVIADSTWVLTPGSEANSQKLTVQVMSHHPYFGFSKALKQTTPGARTRNASGKDWLFYLLTALLAIYGFLRLLFPKYFNDLFRLFFRTTIKQRQIKEQLMQTPLPSLLLNAFFVLSGGLYASFLLQHFGLNTIGNFWLLLLYCCGGLSLLYFVKFAGLKIAGWLFGMEEAADSYVFIVFVVNKMMGILLLPFLVMIAFTVGDLYATGLVLSWCLIGALLFYRFILTYAAIRNQVRVNPFHFFLYLCAFEIAPLLLVYKALLVFFRITA